MESLTDNALLQAIVESTEDGVELLVCNSELHEGAYLRCNGRPIMDDTGDVLGGVVTFRDITHGICPECAEIKKGESAKTATDFDGGA